MSKFRLYILIWSQKESNLNLENGISQSESHFPSQTAITAILFLITNGLPARKCAYFLNFKHYFGCLSDGQDDWFIVAFLTT